MAPSAHRKGSAHSAQPAGFKLPAPGAVRILVAGEAILDRYLWGEVGRISPEAPIPVLRVTGREEKPGNAGFVMANLRALGADVIALSVVGADRDGQMLVEIFRDLGIDTSAILTDPDRPTTVKERMLGSVQAARRGTQQLLRVDQEDSRPLGPARERELLGRIAKSLAGVKGILVSDINKGLLSPRVLRELIKRGRKRGIPIVVDPRLSEDFSIYRGATVLTPNRYETELATGVRLSDREAWRKAAEKLVSDLGLEACLITLDREGMYLAERGGRDSYIPTAPRDVYDVTGAGDVVLSVFGLFVAAGLGFASAAGLANLAASLEVTRLGSVVVGREDLSRALTAGRSSYERKILAASELKRALTHERRRGRTICFTNGCFDLIHAGHVQALSFARSQADLLVVGLNSDRSVRAIKGDGRPVYPAAERARILAALEAVDYVVVFDETRARRIIRTVRPDVLVKGEDWRGREIDGQEFVESHGGRVMLAPMLKGRSTSVTLNRMRSGSAGA